MTCNFYYIVTAKFTYALVSNLVVSFRAATRIRSLSVNAFVGANVLSSSALVDITATDAVRIQNITRGA